MNFSFKKMQLAITIALTAMNGLMNAESDYYDLPEDCCQDSRYQPEYMCYGYPSEYPYIDPEGSWMVRADVLYWHSSADNLSFGTEDYLDETTGVDVYKDKNLEFDWNVGFRAAVGYDLPDDWSGWDVDFLWTHLVSTAHGRFKIDSDIPSDTFTPNWGGSSSGFLNIFKSKARWKGRVDLVDGELGRDLFINTCLRLRPFIGFRAGWVDQTYNIYYDDQNHTPIGETKLKTNYSAIGLRLGIDSEWTLGCGFSIYGNAAGSVLYGKVNNHLDAKLPSVTGALTTFSNLKGKSHASRAIADAAAGIQWRETFWCDNVAIILQLGWEHIYLWNQSSFENLTDSSVLTLQNPHFTSNDLCLHGVTFSAKLDF